MVFLLPEVGHGSGCEGLLPTSPNLHLMEKHRFPYLIERDEDGWYVATVPDLPGCHTQARSLDELRERVREAVEANLAALTPEERSELNGEFIGFQEIEVAA